MKAYFDLTAQFQPDVVISDFETWSYLYGKLHGLPVVSLDNIQIVNRCTHPPDVLAGKETDFLVAKAVVKAKLPGCFHYLITSFFRPGDPPAAHQPPPADAAPGDPARPAPSRASTCSSTRPAPPTTALPEILAGCGRECRIYGLRRDLTRRCARGTCATGPSASRPSSRTCAPRARWSPAAASRS